MRIISLCILAISAFLLFNTSFASNDRIVIQDPPTVLQKQGDSYYFATGTGATVTDTRQPEYYYFTINNTNNVCYSDIQQYLDLTPTIVSVKIANTTHDRWCYPADPNFFDIQ